MPDAVCILFDGQEYSRREIGASADEIASDLRRMGVQRGDRVAVYMDRSPLVVTAILAIFKIGAVYVPCAKEYPLSRTQYVVQDSAASVIISDDLAIETTAVRYFPDSLLRGGYKNLSESDCVASDSATDVDPAYIIYTSGSTGTPKGVVNTVEGLMNRLLWQRECFAIWEQDVVLSKAPYGFDISLWETLLPIVSGARLAISTSQESTNLQSLIRLIKNTGVTIAQFVPSMLGALLISKEFGRALASARIVVSSGEALTRKLADRLFMALPGVRLFNFYGPAEASICVLFKEVLDDGLPITLGQPIWNTNIYILDGHYKIVSATKVTGRLAIAGIGVGLGYIGSSPAEGFMENPYQTVDGWPRLFVTSDLAFINDDGDFVFVGRVGTMDKIRGARVDLSEIEALALRVPGVEACHVRFHRVDGVVKAIQVACRCIEASHHISVQNALMMLIKQHLPAYMFPEKIVMTDEFPLTCNGKVDADLLFA